MCDINATACELAGSVELELAIHGVHGIGFGTGPTMLASNGGVSERIGPIGTGGSILGTARCPEAIGPGRRRSNIAKCFSIFSKIK